MNILDFDKWSNSINEGIDTNISSDDGDSKDEITIDDTTYIIKKNKVSTNDVEISDNKLKTDIKNANRAIGDLKETEERFEELRLTGGEDTKIAKEVINIINDDDNNYTKSDISLYNEIHKECSDFFKPSGNGKIVCIQMPNLENSFESEITTKIKNIFSRNETGIGKGEYFLPLLYKDVHKKRPFGVDPYTGERVKGDNYISNGDNIYNLELKSPNASLNFNSYGETYIKTNLENDPEGKEVIYKKAITSRFLKYAQSQAKSFGGNFYMCIFDEQNPPEYILFINLSKIEDNDIKPDNNTELFKTIYNCIDIVNINNYTDGKKGKKNDIAYSFTFTYDANSVNNEEIKKLKCILKSRLIKESIILSRDNFVNEIYTK